MGAIVATGLRALCLSASAVLLIPDVAAATQDEWSPVGPGPANAAAINDDVYALLATPDGVLVGGDFYNVGGTGPNTLDDMVLWDGVNWSAFGSYSGNGALSAAGVRAIAKMGDDIYVGGTFTGVFGNNNANYIAWWDDSAGTWNALGTGLNNSVYALAVNGNTLYAGGSFTDAPGTSGDGDYVASWNGSSWSAVGSFNSDGALNHTVNALAIKNGTLYAGGDFTEADGVPEADYVSKFDGSNWVALGGDTVNDIGALNRPVYSLLVDGSNIVVGGDFDDADNAADTAHIAQWGGGAWSSLGSGASLNDDVLALATDGNSIFAGGRFTDAGGHGAADKIAAWNGSSWEALPDGSSNEPFTTPGTVSALAVWDGDLYAGGTWPDVDGDTAAAYLASWGLPPDVQPDGRIRNGQTGAWTGNNIYNTTGQNQKKQQSGGRNAFKAYQLSIQNDSPTESDVFTLDASAGSVAQYTITYFDGALDVTAAIVGGTYVTPLLAPGAHHVIDVEVQYNNAAAGSKVTRTVTITSNADNSKQDAVKFVAKR